MNHVGEQMEGTKIKLKLKQNQMKQNEEVDELDQSDYIKLN